MKLRRYNHFINESIEITSDLLEVLIERGKFWNEIFELDYSQFDFNRSYSDMCKRKSRNPEQDFQKIQKHFDEKGFTLENIKDLFSEENNMRCGYSLVAFYTGESYPINEEPLKSIVESLKKKLKLEWTSFSRDDYDTILQPFSVGARLDSQGAIQDIYLYKLFEKLGLDTSIVRLGGDGWGDIDSWENGEDYSEAFIRYRYGYHQTEYGKLWMKQCHIDENWLKEKAMDDLQKYIEDRFSIICTHILRSIVFIGRSKSGTTIETRQLKLEDFSITEEDRIIVDIDKLCQEILKLNGQFEVKHSDIEAAAAEFVKEMEGFSLDIELTDTDDLIIWGKFKED
jgi:hypothetical protein